MAKVFIIEDDNFLRTLLKKKMQKVGFEVFEFSDVEGVLESARNIRPDLIVLDIIFQHNKEGIQVISEIRNDPELRGIPIIVLTRIQDPAELKEGLKFGFEGYLVKTQTTLEEVIDWIQKFIG